MKNYKKILLAAAATLAFALDASAADKLRIGTEGAYPPFNGIDASGQAVGFDLDIGKALCAKMKTECEVVTSDWDGIIPALNAKKFDFIVASMSITDERKQAVDFTDPYYTNKLQFVAPKSVDFKTDKDSLKGKVIGAQRATIAGTWLEDNMADVVTIKLYDTQENAYLDLGQGADQPAGELPGGTLGLQRKRRGRTLTGQAEQAEFVFERRDDLQAAVAIAFHLGPQQAARAGRPRRAVGFHQVAVQVVERRRSGVGTLLDAHPAVRVGQQAQVAVAAPGAALVDQVLRGQRAVRRYPAATAGQLLLQGRQGQRTPAGDAGQVGGDEADQAYRLQAVHRLLRPRAAMRCRTVSVSLIQQ